MPARATSGLNFTGIHARKPSPDLRPLCFCSRCVARLCPPERAPSPCTGRLRAPDGDRRVNDRPSGWRPARRRGHPARTPSPRCLPIGADGLLNSPRPARSAPSRCASSTAALPADVLAAGGGHCDRPVRVAPTSVPRCWPAARSSACWPPGLTRRQVCSPWSRARHGLDADRQPGRPGPGAWRERGAGACGQPAGFHWTMDLAVPWLRLLAWAWPWWWPVPPAPRGWPVVRRPGDGGAGGPGRLVATPSTPTPRPATIPPCHPHPCAPGEHDAIARIEADFQRNCADTT